MDDRGVLRVKIVIWGFGGRGKALFNFLGANNVAAFIDSNKRYEGANYHDVPVIDVARYVEKYSDYLVVVSPIEQTTEILEIIKKYNIKLYTTLSESSDLFFRFDLDEVMKYMEDRVDKAGPIYIYGLHLLNFIFANWLVSKKIKNVYLVQLGCITEQKKKVVSLLCPEVIVKNANDLPQGASVYCSKRLSEDEQYELSKKKINAMEIYHVDYFAEKRFNPIIRSWHNIYKGKSGFIVATGPSLRIKDLETIHSNKSIVCISMNEIYKAFNETKWRPDYFVMNDAAVVDYAEIIDEMDVKYKIVTEGSAAFWEKKHPDNVIKVNSLLSHVSDDKFSDDYSVGFYGHGTVTYNCLQLACYLGFSDIYLIGCDFFDANQKDRHYGHFYKEDKLEAVCFYPEVLDGYKIARRYADEHGIHIYNATRGGYLEIFNRVEFDSLFTDGKFTPERSVIHPRKAWYALDKSI